MSWDGMRYSSIASSDVTWEIATKHDAGIDFSFFNDRLTGSVDYFYETRDNIYMTRSYLPWIVGVESSPKANVGKTKAQGFDGHFALKQKIGNVNLTLRGNMTCSKNEVLAYDEENSIYDYKPVSYTHLLLNYRNNPMFVADQNLSFGLWSRDSYLS